MKLDFPDSTKVNNAMFRVAEVVKDYGLQGKWVTSWGSSAEEDFATTPEICKVSDISSFDV